MAGRGDHEYHHLPRAQLHVVQVFDPGERGMITAAAVLVDGEAVAHLPLTAWSTEGSPDGTCPKLTVTVHLGDLDVSSLGRLR